MCVSSLAVLSTPVMFARAAVRGTCRRACPHSLAAKSHHVRQGDHQVGSGRGRDQSHVTYTGIHNSGLAVDDVVPHVVPADHNPVQVCMLTRCDLGPHRGYAIKRPCRAHSHSAVARARCWRPISHGRWQERAVRYTLCENPERLPCVGPVGTRSTVV